MLTIPYYGHAETFYVLKGVPVIKSNNVVVAYLLIESQSKNHKLLISFVHDGTECDGRGFPATIIELLLMSPSNMFL